MILQTTQLCLCLDAEFAEPKECVFLSNGRVGEHSGGYKSHFKPDDLPLMEIVLRIFEARSLQANSHVLILRAPEVGRADVTLTTATTAAHVHVVEVCNLDRIDHVDLLHSLAMGVDRVLLQRAGTLASCSVQDRELNLAQQMGGGGRLLLFSDTAEAVELLNLVPPRSDTAIAQSPIRGRRRRDISRACATVLLDGVGETITLPEGATYGSVHINASRCTMCHGCAWMCPTDALRVDEQLVDLFFVEKNCIQCGICRSVCAVDAIELTPRLTLGRMALRPRVLHTAEAFPCTECDEPVAPRQRIERLLDYLRQSPQSPVVVEQMGLVQMCENCRERAVRQRAPIHPDRSLLDG